MELLWQHVFDLVERMWELNQSDIAKYLSVHRSTISKLKKGTQSQFNRPCNELYRNLFDPTNPESPVNGKDPRELLRDIKDAIKDAGLTDSTKGVKDDNYEAFVIGLLKLAKENQSKLATQSGIVANAVTDNKNNDQEVYDAQPERMLDLCRECFKGFPIEKFIDSNPADSIKSYLIEDAVTVVGRIRHKHEKGDSPDKHSEIYQSIVKFADALLEFLKFLKSASANLNILDEGYKPLNSNDNGFLEETNKYHQQLKLLYQIIMIEIEKEEIEYHEQRRAAHEEAWEQNTQVGAL